MAAHSNLLPGIDQKEAATQQTRSESAPSRVVRDIETAEAQPVSPPSDLKPKEHGAYAILAIPMVSALIIGGPTIAGWCIAIASLAGFFAHEPLLVLMGRRGRRAQRSTPLAKYRLAMLLVTTIGCGMVAMLLSENAQRVALVLCFLLAVISFTVAAFGKHRSLAGQLWGVVGLSAPCLPILLIGGVPLVDALQIWSIFLVGFVATTLSVRGVIAAQKQQPRATHWFILLALSIGVGITYATGSRWSLAVVPMIAMGWYLMLRPPPAKYLKRVGWSLVSGTLLTAAATIFAFAGV